MTFNRFHRRGQGALEYMCLIAFVIVTFVIFQKYMARGFTGRWQSAGESFGHGRQYDPKKTVECVYYEGSALTGKATKVWYNSVCFDNACLDDCYSVGKNPTKCGDCMNSCSDALCRDTQMPNP